MFKIIILIVFLLFMYMILKNEKKAVKFTILTYFTLLSIVFITGHYYITTNYQLNDAPVEGGFMKLGSWVDIFSHIFIIPTFLALFYKLFQFVRKSIEQRWVRIVLYIFWSLVLLGIYFLSYFFFILTFYGFAP